MRITRKGLGGGQGAASGGSESKGKRESSGAMVEARASVRGLPGAAS